MRERAARDSNGQTDRRAARDSSTTLSTDSRIFSCSSAAKAGKPARDRHPPVARSVRPPPPCPRDLPRDSNSEVAVAIVAARTA